MKKSVYGLILAGALFLSTTLWAQPPAFLSELDVRLTTLQETLSGAEKSLLSLKATFPENKRLATQKENLILANENLTTLRSEREALAKADATFAAGTPSQAEKVRHAEDQGITLPSLSSKATGLEQPLSQIQIALAGSTQSHTAMATRNDPKVELDVIPYVYQEFEAGYSLEVKLPNIEGTDAAKSQSQQWMDRSQKRMQEVKQLGTAQNQDEPSSPQYLWLANYTEFHNEQLGATSFVVTFYEYTGDLPGMEQTEVAVIKADGTSVDALDLLTPQQVQYVKRALNDQVKSDVARPDSDLDKRHLKNAAIDLSKAAVYFTEDSLEIQFATGEMNNKLGRAALLSLPLADVLAQ